LDERVVILLSDDTGSGEFGGSMIQSRTRSLGKTSVGNITQTVSGTEPGSATVVRMASLKGVLKTSI
jgi:hypothetical protein